MNVKHLDHLNLSVSNFKESADWYHRIFGFEIVEEGKYRGSPWGVLKSGDAMLCIYEDPVRKYFDGDDLRSKGMHGINHFALRIVDKKNWEKTIARENVEVYYGGAYRWSHSTSWYIKDPTGYDIEVVNWDDDKAQF